MSYSESILIQPPGTERTTNNVIEGSNDNNDLSNQRTKKFQMISIEEKLKVKSPQIIKRKYKIDDINHANKNKGSNILDLNSMSGRVMRKDANGVEINSMNKRKIRVTFIDKISSIDLVQIHDIENLKLYNVGGYGQPEKNYGKIKHQCNCSLF